MEARDRYRWHALDGAWLAFQPSTGMSVRVRTERTASIRRRAPRVVLFSLSHACDLRCGFCSRDASQKARWELEPAFETLAALWRAGTLEVSFGGGEPLVHRGFVELLEHLHRETTLALHFTTNGTRVTPALARTLAPLVGEVRLSVYEDSPWERALTALCAAGCRVGVNIMVRGDTLARLPERMARAKRLGARDVAVLRYVGDGPAMADAELHMLEQAVLDAPLPVRLSNCFLDALPNLPRLFPGVTLADRDGRLRQDCGAGRDFVVIDPDAAVRSCSFHADPVPLDDIGAWLDRYREGGALVPSPRGGCARPVPLRASGDEGAFVYRGFASNNSGDTLLVARFEAVTDARRFMRRVFGEGVDDQDGALLCRDQQAAEPWQEESERVVRVGRSVLASGYDSDDALPELRAWLWEAGAMPVYSMVHSHDDPELVFGVKGPRPSDAARLSELGMESSVRGPVLLGHGQTDDWAESLAALSRLFEGRGWSAEMLQPRDGERWADAMKHLDAAPWGPAGHLVVRMPSPSAAERLVTSLEGAVSVAGDTVLCDMVRFRPRLGAHAAREGGCAWWIPRGPVQMRLWSYAIGWKGRERPELDALERAAAGEVEVEVHRYGVGARARTDEPHAAMRAMQRVFAEVQAVAKEARGGVFVGADQPLRAAARRVRHELTVV